MQRSNITDETYTAKDDVQFFFTSSCLQEGMCLIYIICVCLCIVVSNTYCAVVLLCFSSSCCQFLCIVFFFNCHFGILSRLFTNYSKETAPLLLLYIVLSESHVKWYCYRAVLKHGKLLFDGRQVTKQSSKLTQTQNSSSTKAASKTKLRQQMDNQKP